MTELQEACAMLARAQSMVSQTNMAALQARQRAAALQGKPGFDDMQHAAAFYAGIAAAQGPAMRALQAQCAAVFMATPVANDPVADPLNAG